MANAISPQGYDYPFDKSKHPFYTDGRTETPGEVPDITASASVDDTTGTPAVSVEKSGSDPINFAFAFSGIKGEKGETGEQGPAGKDGTSATVTATGNTGSGEIAGTVSDGTTTVTIYNGAKGETGATGPQGEAGATPTDYVKNVTITATNSQAEFVVEKGDGTSATTDVPIGSSSTVNGIVEVKDTVVENNTDGYDFHTFTETEDNGIENEIGKFCLARNQMTKVYSLSYNDDVSGVGPREIIMEFVSQDGTMGRNITRENINNLCNYKAKLPSYFSAIVFAYRNPNNGLGDATLIPINSEMIKSLSTQVTPAQNSTVSMTINEFIIRTVSFVQIRQEYTTGNNTGTTTGTDVDYRTVERPVDVIFSNYNAAEETVTINVRCYGQLLRSNSNPAESVDDENYVIAFI